MANGSASAAASQAMGKCCRVWLPDSVLPAGDKLRVALEGNAGSNFAFLRKKYADSVKFSIYGQASLDTPPWKRLQVVATAADSKLMSQIETDLVDLAETACDVVADALGLSEDQVQRAFEEIRVEQHDVMHATQPSKPAGAENTAAAQGLLSGAGIAAAAPLLPEGLKPAPPARPSALRGGGATLAAAPPAKRASDPSQATDGALHKKRKSDKSKDKDKVKDKDKDKKSKKHADKAKLRAEAQASAKPTDVTDSKTPVVSAPAAPSLQAACAGAVAEGAPQKAAAGESGDGSSSGSEESDSTEAEGAAGGDEGALRVKLYKLGDFCCEVVATFMGGNKYPQKLASSLHIDQRAKLERCVEHVEWAGDLASVWKLTVTKGHEAYKALADYFVSKQRVGLAEMPRHAVYVVPPEDEFLSALDLTAVSHLVCIQVPTVDDREEVAPAALSTAASGGDKP